MNLFFDTSALVKYYHREKGTDTVTNLIQNNDNNIYILDIAHLELLSAIFRRYRNSELSNEELDIALNGIEKELERYNVEPSSYLIHQQGLKLLKRFGKAHGLRTLDALHTACFTLIDTKNVQMISSDDIMCSIAEELGYSSLNPMKT